MKSKFSQFLKIEHSKSDFTAPKQTFKVIACQYHTGRVRVVGCVTPATLNLGLDAPGIHTEYLKFTLTWTVS